MISIVVGVLALVLFPVWPFSVKYAIWLISLYLLIILVGLLLFRLVIYLICVAAGFNVWIFPNLLGDYGFVESFKPIFYA
jgi:translocation protein SEC62